MRMKKMLVFLLVAVVLLTLAGCAAGPNDLAKTPNVPDGDVAGFWDRGYGGLYRSLHVHHFSLQ